MKLFDGDSSVLVEYPGNPSASLELCLDVVDEFSVFLIAREWTLT